jgi:hypothetical protein
VPHFQLITVGGDVLGDVYLGVSGLLVLRRTNL